MALSAQVLGKKIIVEEKETVIFLCQAKRKHSRLAPQELFRSYPHLVRGYIVWGGVCEKEQGSKSLVFFLLQSCQMVRLLTRIGYVQGLR